MKFEEKKRIRQLCDRAVKIRKERFDSDYQEAVKFCRPIRRDWSDGGPDMAGGSNQPDRTVIDSIGTHNTNIGAQGFHGYSMSPAMRWWRFSPSTRKLERSRAVSVYLQTCEDRIALQMDRSNVYIASGEAFKDWIATGIGVMWLGENALRDGLQAVAIHIKRIGLMTSETGEITGVVRDAWLTADELKERFGKLPEGVASLSDADPGATFPLKHVAMLRRGGKVGAIAAAKPWASYWFYTGPGALDGWDLLKESGFDSNPYLIARWDVVAEAPYAIGPGIYALPDLRMLQELKRARLKSVQLLAERPLMVSKTLRGRLNYQPRGITFADPGEQAHPLVDGSQPFSLDSDIAETRAAIDNHFYRQLFTVLLSNPKGLTAFEASGIQSEQAALLGPPVSRLQSEFLIPLLRRVWEIEAAAGRLPAPPQELQNEDVSVDFLGLLAQLQKRHARITGTIQALSGIQVVASLFPQSLDNYDGDVVSTGLADAYGMDQEAIRDESDVRKLREARMKAQVDAVQQQQQAAMTQALLSNADKVSALAPPNPLGGLGGGR